MARPSTALSFAEDTQRLRQSEIILLGDLERAFTAAHDDYGQPDLLAQRGVVGRDAIRFARLTMSTLNDLSRESLGRLGAPKSEPVDSLDDLSARINALQGVRDRDGSDSPISLPRLVDNAPDRLAGYKRTSGVVNDYDLT